MNFSIISTSISVLIKQRYASSGVQTSDSPHTFKLVLIKSSVPVLILKSERLKTRGGFSVDAPQHALSNVYFHMSIAYANLRHNGVEIGKKDYLGELPYKK